MPRPRGSAAAREACTHGHSYPENLAFYKTGISYCAECKRIRARTYWQDRYPPAIHDDIAVERAIAGDPPDRLAASERAAAVLALTARGLPASLVAEQVRCSKRTVHRIRSRYATAA
ncbi:helix-turn-helix domain-containing protein [Streptomyces xanthophaeus]